MPDKQKNIVYIDDDKDMLLLVQAVLEQDPAIKIHTFESPFVALEEIEDIDPDMIILDYSIPGMKGTSVMKEIQQLNINVPIVFFTAQSSPEEHQRIKSLGASKVIVKPLDIDLLRDELMLV